MKCPGCGYVSFDPLETCKRCGAPLAATGSRAQPPADPDVELHSLRLEPEAPASPARRRGPRRRRGAEPADQETSAVEMLDDDALQIGEEDLEPPPVADAPFSIDEDLFDAAHPEPRGGDRPLDELVHQDGDDQAEPAFTLREEDGHAGWSAPVIDREEEIPDRFWAPEIAGLGRRATALIVDQALLALVLGLFFVGAFVALRLSGFDTDAFLAAAGLRAAAAPFAMLAVLVSFSYFSFFHGYAGRTPGKTLAGVEVVTRDGLPPSWARVQLRWLCAAVGLAGGGIGLAWALFEPRHRGWADLLSGTVVARRHEPGEGNRR